MNKKQEVSEKVIDLIFDKYKISIGDGIRILWNCLKVISQEAKKYDK